MRIFVIVGLLCCLLLSGCELLTPDASSALSQTRQIEEMQKQTEQLQRQADALERLANEASPVNTAAPTVTPQTP